VKTSSGAERRQDRSARDLAVLGAAVDARYGGPVDASDDDYRPYQGVGLVLGPAIAGAMLFLPPPDTLAPAAWHTAAVAALMAVWWATEALPLAVTALVPLIAFPLLGIADATASAAPFADPLIFLFLGGFLLALSVERWGLHRRIALSVIARVGTRPGGLTAGFMVVSAGLSMWVSNTATTMMLLPVAASVVAVAAGGSQGFERDGPDDRDRRNFAVALLLGVAYGASIGGMGTLIGTPPNAFLAAYVGTQFGLEIGFAAWMAVGLPVVAVLLPVGWFVLTWIAFPTRLVAAEGTEAVRDALGRLGPLSIPERRVAAVLSVVAAAWMARPAIAGWPGLGGISDTTIAVAGGLAMFIVPAGTGRSPGNFLLRWADARRLPWGVLLLFGGGLSLAAAVTGSGLADWIGELLGFVAAIPPWAAVLSVTAVVVFLTELTSNTATAAGFLPIVAALAPAAGLDPLALMVPVTLAASCAFMLPVATPPNAIVFASGHVTVPQMVRAGILLNLAAIVLLTVIATVLVPVVLVG
jgi:sodium-dependent dicarboxylate transporter 2/3/5